MGMTHPSHPDHELEMKNYRKPYICDGCKQIGFGPRHRCDQCNFDLHEHCMSPKEAGHHDFLETSPSNSSVNLLQNAQTEIVQTARDTATHVENLFEVLSITVKKKGWDLHPCCQNLPNKLLIEDVEFKLRDKVSSKCMWCKKKNLKGTMSGIRGWSYVSKREDYRFHVYCATEMMLDGWQNGAFSYDNNSLALENLELPTESALSTNRRSGNKFMKMVKIVLQTIVGILLGDPTVIITGLLVELIGK